ncbi:MAG TPA: DUF2339 domain-containing protein [Longimicrobiaceae bacterium]|nr:DUF2339 domain-containing protein [Longimicrobiaceae bacterium]
MQDPRDEALEARLARLERLVEELQRRLPPVPAGEGGADEPAEARPRRVPAMRRLPWAELFQWDGQVWLNRLGIALVLLGIALLFRYSIEQGWLTPAVRVLFGLACGVVLFAAGLRLGGRRRFASVLVGGGIATFYLTGFAAFHLYALIGYLAALAAMVGITFLAFSMALRKGEPALALLGAAGGLGTPLILGLQHGTPRGFALYTCIVLGWTVAVYLRRGWRSLLWTSLAGGWLLLVLYSWHAHDAVRATAVDRWTLQGAAVFAWLAVSVLPLAREVRLRRAEPARAGRRWSDLDALYWHGLALLPPLAALGVTAQVWRPTTAEWGALALACAAGYALAAWALYRRDPRIARVVLLTASVLLSAGSVAALGGNSLLLALAGQALALHALANRGGGAGLRWMAHKVFIAAAAWVLFRLAIQSDEVGTARVAADLSVILCGFVCSYVVPHRREALAYRYWCHVALLGWLWRQLAPLDGGQGYATIAWGAYGLGLLLLAMRQDRRVLEKTAIATLLVTVAKLFLVDLAALEAIFRVLLFLGFGSVFLFLSYWLQAWWRQEHAPEGDGPAGRRAG